MLVSALKKRRKTSNNNNNNKKKSLPFVLYLFPFCFFFLFLQIITRILPYATLQKQLRFNSIFRRNNFRNLLLFAKIKTKFAYKLYVWYEVIFNKLQEKKYANYKQKGTNCKQKKQICSKKRAN